MNNNDFFHPVNGKNKNKKRTTDEDNKNADAIQFCRNHLQTRHQSPEAVAFSREAISRIIRFPRSKHTLSQTDIYAIYLLSYIFFLLVLYTW